MAAALAPETQLSNVSSDCSVAVHDLFFSNIVGNEVKTPSNVFDSLNLSLEAVFRCEIEIFDYRCKL